MCGFAGIIAWDDRYRVERAVLEKMSDCVAHRGPDAQGLWIDAKQSVGLAHRRLAILDLDRRADQPFTDDRGRWVVYNGEIYNFRELRNELGQHAWKTTCDTEVLLASYDAWGEACVERFIGMFAFAIWDERRRELFLARDRMGQKPLYYTVAPDNNAIGFASELSALRALPWLDTALDEHALGDYLRWGYIPCPRTIWRGAAKLPPAHRARVTQRDITIERYFDPNQSLIATENDVIAQTRRLVTQSVARRLVADVPLGCFLSGGIDSSIVAAAMKASVPADQPVLTFSIGFDDPRYDETPHAAAVAKYLGTKHQQFIVRPDAAGDLPKLARGFGEPFADSSALPTHYLSRETRGHVKVALSGDGGDELFAGYERYRALLLGESFRLMPQHLQKIAASKMWQRLPGTHPKSHLTRVKRLLASLELSAGQRYDSFMRLFDEPLLVKLLPQPMGDSNWLVEQFGALSNDRDVVRAAMALDRVTYLPEDLLTKVDRASMLHALEVRSPFMDHQLVHFAAALSTNDLLGHGVSPTAFIQSPMNGNGGKRLLRLAFSRDLPPSVFKRRKMGFAVPIGQWFRTELRDLLRDAVLSRDSFCAAHFHRDVIEQMIEQHQTEKVDHSQRLYALLMLELWQQHASSL